MEPIVRYPVHNDAPAIRFEVGAPPGKFPTRSMLVRDRRVYDLQVVCDTCAFLFEKVGYETRLSPEEVGRRLAAGVGLLDPDLLGSVARLLPTDEYGVVATRFVPVLTGPGEPDDYFAHESVAFFGLDPTWGVPDTPRVRYWRAGSSVLPTGAGATRGRVHEQGTFLPEPQRFFHFVVPIEPPHIAQRARVDEYRTRMAHGEEPAAVGVSVLDVRAKAVVPGDDADPALLDATEWCLATFLLDGHHKMIAASEIGAPIRLLAFVARRPSIALEEDFPVVLDELARWAAPGSSPGRSPSGA